MSKKEERKIIAEAMSKDEVIEHLEASGFTVQSTSSEGTGKKKATI